MTDKKQKHLRLVGYISIVIGIMHLYIPIKVWFQSTFSLMQTARLSEQLFRLSLKMLHTLVFINIPLAAIGFIMIGYGILKATKKNED